jgi:hypothetical protein
MFDGAQGCHRSRCRRRAACVFFCAEMGALLAGDCLKAEKVNMAVWQNFHAGRRAEFDG